MSRERKQAAAKEKAALKRENQRFRKELSRNDRYSLDEDETQEQKNLREIEQQEFSSYTKTKEKKEEVATTSCRKCKSKMEIIELGTFTYKFCTDRVGCKHREKVV